MNTSKPLSNNAESQRMSNNAQNICLESIKQIFLEVKICNPTAESLVSIV